MQLSHTSIALLLCVLSMTSLVTSSRVVISRSKRANTIGDILGDKGKPKKKQANVKITPPLTRSPGETAEQAPGWKHCIKNMKATLNWKSFKSPGYPDFLESQIQCSWIIEAPIGMKVKIAFRDLDMIGKTGSCAKQFVQIIDVGTGKSQGRFCGSQRPGDYVTSKTQGRLDLQADKAVTKVRGFFISFVAVRERPGFRSTKSLPAATNAASGGAPGKVNLKNFASATENMPKSPTANRRGPKRLIYESDRNPLSTDPDATTESAAVNTIGGDADFGWIGDDSDISSSSGGSRNPTRKPASASGSRTRPVARRPAQAKPMNAKPTNSPVRILAIPPKPKPVPKDSSDSTGIKPIIYGVEIQPYDPALYTTKFPVRANKVIDNRPEKLSTVNLIVIIACCGLFVLILFVIITFCWYYRKRKRKIKKKHQQERLRKQQGQNIEDKGTEMNILSRGGGPGTHPDNIPMKNNGRQHYLPTTYPPPRNEHPMAYPQNGRLSFPRDVANNPMDNLHGQHVNTAASLGEMTSYANDAMIREDTRPIQRLDGPSHIQIRDDDMEYRKRMQEQTMQRPSYRQDDQVTQNDIFPPYNVRQHQPRDGARFSYHGEAPRMRTPSPPRHMTLDPRKLNRLKPSRQSPQRHFHGPPANMGPAIVSMRQGTGTYPGRVEPWGRGPQRVPPMSRMDSRPLPPEPREIPPRQDYDDDYCSETDDPVASNVAPMRREYSQWELEKQKREKKLKLIQGEI